MRSEIIDGRVLPVENLATNPSFERAVAGTTVVRRNLHPTPTAQSAWLAQYWGDAANSGTTSRVLGAGPNGEPVFQATYTTVVVTNKMGTPVRAGNDNSIPVIAGRTYTASMYTKSSIVWNPRQRIRWLTSSYATISDVSSGWYTNTPQDTWIRISYTYVAPPNAAYMWIGVEAESPNNNLTPGVVVMGTKALIEERPVLMPYFDGSTTDNTGITYAWEGTAGASTSVAKSSVVEVRRNLESNPNPAAAYGAAAPSTAAITTETTTPPFGTTQYWRATSDVNTSTLGFDSRISLSVAAGFTGTRSLYVRLSKAATVSASLIGTGAVGSTTISSSSVAASANTWTRVYVTATTTTAGDFGIRIRTTGTSFVAGDTIDIAALLTESGTTVGTYFDGTITPDADLTPAWTGTTNGSASTLSGVVVSTAASNGNGYGKNILSWAWADKGNSSVRVYPDSSSISDTFVAPGGLNLSAFALGMQPGYTYTVLAKLRLTSTQTGSLYGTARQIEAVYGPMAGSWSGAVYQRSSSTPNSAGVYTIRLTFKVGSTAAWAAVRLYNGTSQGNGDAWWDSFMLVEGVYTGPYIDGDAPGCVWRGAQHNSRSVGYPAGV
jgi:hypothetical protein